MSKINKEFKKLSKEVLKNGEVYVNERRNTERLQIPSYTFTHDMSKGFPSLGLKKLPIKSVIGELIWFLRGDNDIRYLIENNINIWNKDAYNWYCKEHDLYETLDVPKLTFKEFIEETKTNKTTSASVGQNYSIQWRDYNGKTDQIENLIKDMKADIMGSRLIVNAWNPSEIHDTALPPCHTFFQIVGIPNKGFELHWNQRSVDLFLGLPFNIASYATLGLILERITGHKFLKLQGDLKCVHFYDNQIELAKELINRDCKYLSKTELYIGNISEDFKNVNISDFDLIGYKSHEAMKVEMLAPDKI